MPVPLPADSTHDYQPVDGPQVRVGWNLLGLFQSTGPVAGTQIVGSKYTYEMHIPNVDGSITYNFGFFPTDPSTQPAQWWLKWSVWKRQAKPAHRFTLTAADGSKWIYSAGGDGRMRCYHTGTTYTQGQSLFRTEINAAGSLLALPSDAQWDWVKITSGDQVSAGDIIYYAQGVAGTVSSIDAAPDANGNPALSIWADADSKNLGRWFAQPLTGGMFFSFFRITDKPAADTTFCAPADGSEWVFTDGAYFCYKPGTTFFQNAVFDRGAITGGLIPIT